MHSNEDKDHLWAVVLAGGEDTRLKPLTTNAQGVSIPKQFCSLDGAQSMLRMTIERAKKFVPRSRIVVVVASQHRPWWSQELKDVDPDNLVIQPLNRGTAVGVLLPTLRIFLRDRKAKTLFLPSDHSMEDESSLVASVEEGLPVANGSFDKILLLGMKPNSPKTGYGWITLSSRRMGRIRHVAGFVEKPPLPVAQSLMRNGALCNSFIFLGAASTLLRLYAKALPLLLKRFLLEMNDLRYHSDTEHMARFYGSLSSFDFSKHLLERSVPNLWATEVPPPGLNRTQAAAEYERVLQLPETRMVHSQQSSG